RLPGSHWQDPRTAAVRGKPRGSSATDNENRTNQGRQTCVHCRDGPNSPTDLGTHKIDAVNATSSEADDEMPSRGAFSSALGVSQRWILPDAESTNYHLEQACKSIYLPSSP